MKLLDVNVLVNAHRVDAPRHRDYRAFLESVIAGEEPYAVPDVVLTGFVRVVTNQRTWKKPATLDEALAFTAQVLGQDQAIPIASGPRFWEIFDRMCRQAEARGNLITDAHIAALAVEHGCEVVSADRDFARFPGLRWRHPLD